MMNINTAWRDAAKRMALVTQEAVFEAQLLLADCLDASRAYLHAHPERSLSPSEYESYDAFITRRVQGEPLAYIRRSCDFYGVTLELTQDVLVPRPETECLIDALLRLQDTTPINLLELGTGSGAIAIAVAKERPSWRIVATDYSSAALAQAKHNATLNQCEHTITWVESNWFAASSLQGARFDVIVSNPPYVSEEEWLQNPLLFREPKMAFVAEDHGYAALFHIISHAKNYLREGGLLLLEHGATQGKRVRDAFLKRGYCREETIRDLVELERVTIGRIC